MTNRIVGITALACFASLAGAQTFHLELRSSSTYRHEPCQGPCACAHPGWNSGLTGTMDVRLVAIGDVFDFYAVENVRLLGYDGAIPVALTGGGTYQQSGITHQQAMSLALSANGTINYQLNLPISTIAHPLPYLNIAGVSEIAGCNRLTLSMTAVPQCPGDLDDGSAQGAPDGAVTIDDLLYFLTQYHDGGARADVDDGNASGLPDGAVTIDDLLFLLGRYEAGC